ncbi:MAG: DUF3500 domain-containing protein [Planctomycetota bacterium]|nr:DUF3500 domain-containing protein [Planctomycetota bacterium]
MSKHAAPLPSVTDPCDLHAPQDRRSFLRAVGGAALAGVVASPLLGPLLATAAPTNDSPAEKAVLRFYQTLTAPQKEAIVLPFEHELRKKISANWHVTKPRIGEDFYTDEQRKIIDEIVRNVTSPDGYERIKKQTEFDDGGLDGYSVAVFGTPGSGKFEWELTGRHLTLRADGNSVDKAAFGGPIIYGHGEENPKQNLFLEQTHRVNQVFRALDPKQAERALVAKAPPEAAVELQGGAGKFPGVPVGDLSADQKGLVEKTLKHLLSPYRADDVDEVFALLKANGGLDKLHLAFYQEGDLLEDKEWDIWRVEGPGFVWHFRGAPHVHAYINIGAMA